MERLQPWLRFLERYAAWSKPGSVLKQAVHLVTGPQSSMLHAKCVFAHDIF